MVKKETGATKWKCQIQGCEGKPKNERAIGHHVSKQHPGHTLFSNQETTCPFCNKKYANLETMLTHLQLKIGKKEWQACECPLRAKQITDEQIWKLLTQVNKQINMENNQQIPEENRTKEQRITKLPQKQQIKGSTNQDTKIHGAHSNRQKYKMGNGNVKYKNVHKNAQTKQY